MATTLDMNDVISLAKKNQKEASGKTKIGYSTSLQAPTKLERTVNPAAIKAFLDRQKRQTEMKAIEDAKKKEVLQKLRADAKHTKKAKAMATRTKDNLQVYRGEDYLGLHKTPKSSKVDEIPLSPEAERQHRAFMKKISKMSYDNKGGGQATRHSYSSDEDDRKIKKMEKNRKKSRKAAAGMNFNDLLKLAEQQKETESTEDESESEDTVSSDSDDSEDGLTAQEKYEREKRKRKELEARLKSGGSGKGVKRKSGDLPSVPLKIGKLQSGLSEESKKQKIQAIMAKFGQKKCAGPSSSDNHKSTVKTKAAASKPNNSTSVRTAPPNDRTKGSLNGGPTSKMHRNSKAKTGFPTNQLKTKSLKQTEIASNKKQSTKANPPPKEKVRTNPYLEAMKKAQMANAQKKSVSYNEMMAKAQSNMAKSSTGQCKLSVQSHAVRTNYPGVAETDPKNPSYQKLKKQPSGLPNGSRLTPAEEYRRRALAAKMHPRDVAAMCRRAQVLHDDDDDEDEYDSDMEGFIDDGDGDYDNNISAQIGAIFGYDRNKYGRESEYELSKMDASYKDIQKEEKRSLRIAQIEDAQEAKLEEERLKKRQKDKRR